MGLADFETFIQERLAAYDETLDLSTGSPIDTQVIQPVLRRIGTDPFTVDAATFIVTRLRQGFPDLAASDGDAITDLLAKPALLLWDPLIREIQRVKNMLSLRDPTILTIDEADALGANIFAQRDQGDFSRGIARIYFAQPQPISISQGNFFTTTGGLHFFPTGQQSIKSAEMLLNVEGDLYYFDVNTIAETTGDQYNIDPNQISTIANVSSAVRVTNKARFRFGIPEEDAVTFLGRVENDLTERSLVTQRGIISRVGSSFPDVTAMAVIGFNDPEMQRDFLTGGGLGPMVAAGGDASAYPDGEFKATTRRVRMPSADFFSVIGPVGPVKTWVLTLFNAFSAPPLVRDLPVAKVIDQTTLELVDQSVLPGTLNAAWCLRQTTLTLSGIPGGIIFPDGPTGTVEVPPDQVHIGGCTDMLLRTVAFDSSSLILDLLEDDEPLLAGDLATFPFAGAIILSDFILPPGAGANYRVDDDTYAAITDAGRYRYRVRILTGPAAGVYEVIDVAQPAGASPQLFVYPEPVMPPGAFSWQLISVINMDLVTPKETRSKGVLGETTQNVNIFTTTDAVDFGALGGAPGDILEILNGPDASKYTVESITPPFFTQLVLDRSVTTTSTGLQYILYRPNAGGGVLRPLIRTTEIELLDTTGQPVGTTVPYAKPVDGRSNSFQNTGGGVKVSVDDAVLGLVTIPQPLGGFVFSVPGTLQLSWDGGPSLLISVGGTMSVFDLANAINAVSLPSGYAIAVVLSYGNHQYLGVLPVGPNVTTSASDTTVVDTMYGAGVSARTSRDIQSATVNNLLGGWAAVRPVIDQNLDVASVLDGLQAGFYDRLNPGPLPQALQVNHDFAPEVSRKVDVGARSIGSVRLYFLEPTSMEVDQGSLFTTVDANNNTLNFFPDPTLSMQKLPALPGGTIPQDGITSIVFGVNTFQSPSNNFDLSGIITGDELVISYVPITGNLMGPPGLADPVPGLALNELRISIENQPDQFIIFVNDVATAGAVSRQGIADQLNAAAGFHVCDIVQPSVGDFYLQFNATVALVVRQQNGNAASANVALGFSNTADTNNDSPNKGTYPIIGVGIGGTDVLLVQSPPQGPAFAASIDSQQFSVKRVGTQRVSSTEMSNNTDTGGLYYWDVDLVSQGTGSLWNILAGDLVTVSGYRSDGYYLTTTDASTTFSTAEDIKIHFSPSILEVGVDDDPQNATALTGQSVAISYEYSSIVENVQSFVGAETERVVNESPLARSLVPHYVRFTINYTGGSLPTIIQPIMEAYIDALLPTQSIDSGAVQKIVTNKGATFVQNPIELIAVIYNFDRTVTVSRSEGAISTTRLAMFIPDVITLTQKVTS